MSIMNGHEFYNTILTQSDIKYQTEEALTQIEEQIKNYVTGRKKPVAISNDEGYRIHVVIKNYGPAALTNIFNELKANNWIVAKTIYDDNLVSFSMCAMKEG